MTDHAPRGAGGISALLGSSGAGGVNERVGESATFRRTASAAGGPNVEDDLPVVARTAIGLLRAEGSGVLVVPGLWGADSVQSAAEVVTGTAGTLTLTGGAGGGGELSDLLTALSEADARNDSDERAAVRRRSSVDAGAGSPSRTGSRPPVRAVSGETWPEEARSTWVRLGARGAVIVVRSAAAMDEATSRAVARAVDEGSHRILVVVGHFEDLCDRLAHRVAEGRLRWSRVEPIAPTVLAAALERRCGGVVPSVVLGRIHTLSGGHPALVELVVRAAEDAGLLRTEVGGPVWRWDDALLRRSLAHAYPMLLAGFHGAHAQIVTYTGLATVLRTSHLETQFDPRILTSLRSTGILIPYTGTIPRSALVQLGPVVLAWAVEDTVSSGGDVAAWYDFGRVRAGEDSSGLARIALGVWKLRVERTIEPAVAAELAEEALAHSWSEAAAKFLAAVPERGRHGDDLALMIEVLRARTAWATGDVDTALSILTHSRDQLWPDGGTATRAARHAALLVLHLSLYHRVRGFAVLGGQEPGAIGAPGTLDRGLDVARQAGLTLLPDVIERLSADDEAGAIMLVQRQGLAVDFVEEALARLWLGGAVGLRSAHDYGRQVLSSLLDDLDREGGLPYLVESTRAILLIITMFVGWKADDLRVNAREWNLGRLWHPGAHAVDQLIRAVVEMQDDRMGSSLRAALSAAHAATNRDSFGARTVALAMGAAAASYVEGEAAADHGRALRELLARSDPAEHSPHFRFFAEGLALVGSGPTTAEVSAQIIAVAERAKDAGEAAQHQQLLLLAVLGGNPIAISEALAMGAVHRSGRAGMIRMLAEALAVGTGGDQGAGAADPLDTAEAFASAKVGFLANTVLAARWAAETAGGASASHRLVRAVLTAHAEAPEYSWLLAHTAPGLRLNDREHVIVKSLHDGETTGTIAARLGLSPRTVEGVISRLLSRFGVSNRLELVRIAGELVDAQRERLLETR